MVDRTLLMGELAVATEPCRIRMLLGSCVGVVLVDHRNTITGSAHILLPDSQGKLEHPGRYVNTALDELQRRIHVLAGQRSDLFAHVAGGADMFDVQSATTVGQANVKALDGELSRRGIQVQTRHCGGRLARRFAFDTSTGAATVETIMGGAA